MNSLLNSLFENIKNTKEQQYLELRFIDNHKKVFSKFLKTEEFESVKDLVQKYNNDFNCYFGVATRNNTKSGKKADCGFINAIYLDIDVHFPLRKSKALFSTKKTALDHIKRINLGESYVIDSGHGFQIFWIFEEPIKLTEDSISQLESLMKKLSLWYGADSTHDITRVMRIPDSFNIKDSNNPLKCTIIKHSVDNQYTLDKLNAKIDAHPLSKINLKIIKDIKIGDLFFGNFDKEQFKSRSEVDQKIITTLLRLNFTDEEIVTIFDYYATTGKYLEEKENNSNSAKKYLVHSIRNGQEYLKNTEPDVSHIKSRKRLEYIAMTKKKIGYHKITQNSDAKEESTQMTNFVIELETQKKKRIEGKTTSIFSGTIFFDDLTKYKFDDLTADTLASLMELKKYILNNFGPKARYFDKASFLIDAITYCAQNTTEIEHLEFGFNEELDQYITSDLIITKNEFIQIYSPILYSDIGHNNYLGFNKHPEDRSLKEIQRIIYENLLTWDDLGTMLYCLSFTMLPIIYPFLREFVNDKPYLILQGPSGCGKTTIVELMQSFYGNFKNLNSFSSTPTALEIKGHSFKDALYCIDDMKYQNILEKDRNRVQTLFQNYGDETGKNRSNVSLSIREQQYIKGILMVSAEDVVFTETSTIARGIIIPLSNKEPNNEKRNILIEDSRYFQVFTKHFIAFAIRYKLYKEYYKQIQAGILSFTSKLKFEGGNLPRLINNFTIVSLAYIMLIKFFKNELLEEEIKTLEKDYNITTSDLLKKNFNRIQNLKPEEKFEQTLWEMIELKILSLKQINEQLDYSIRQDQIVGYYQVKEDGDVIVSININSAYRKVNQYLISENGLGHSKETIVQKLIQMNKIRIPSADLNTSRVSFGKHGTQRGVEWIGEVPFKELGIHIPGKSESKLL